MRVHRSWMCTSLVESQSGCMHARLTVSWHGCQFQPQIIHKLSTDWPSISAEGDKRMLQVV